VLDRLVALATARGHRSIIARVTGQNEASLALHERHGFVRVGLERQVAYARRQAESGTPVGDVCRQLGVS